MQAKSVISNIQRFCIQDGPGIRTTVFLKGCPLRCAWCANPETQQPSPELMLKSANCRLCGNCVETCTRKALRMENHRIVVNRELCDLCGKCSEACPNRLPVIDGMEMTADEVMEIVIRDKTFYDASGGGLTISGGEPLMHPQFCKELLRHAKNAGISTCIETSLYASAEIVAEMEPDIDYFYFDFKHSDGEKHKRYTGVDHSIICKNIAWLLKKRPDAHMRIPVIPGFNDSAKDIEAICQTLHAFGTAEVELMRYHNLAAAKYHSLGRNYSYEQVPLYRDDQFHDIVQMYVLNSISIVS
ncbi:MAG: glycyl-radical enzyme activating protein [Hespellia sp.]|jgi:pyruvate formate lyase activating enzyme|nr:glycyl-radical enzyme activating protein [Hespellia sp.]